MLLRYARRGNSIRISRPAAEGARKGQLIAVVDLRKFRFRILDGVSATAEEAKEIEEAAQELKSADAEKREATFGFSQSSGRALKYYSEKATELDKQLIGATVRAAYKSLRKASPPNPKAAAKVKRPAVSAEAVAKALYRALADNAKGQVKGEPGAATQTEIRGFWNLHDVARKILSQA
jgi:hypothetical protein